MGLVQVKYEGLLILSEHGIVFPIVTQENTL